MVTSSVILLFLSLCFSAPNLPRPTPNSSLCFSPCSLAEDEELSPVDQGASTSMKRPSLNHGISVISDLGEQNEFKNNLYDEDDDDSLEKIVFPSNQAV